MFAQLGLRVVVIIFGVIQALLGIRLLLGFVEPPSELSQYVPTLINVTDVLIAPFIGFADLLGFEIGELGPAGASTSGFLAQVDPTVVVALVGWSLIELVVVLVLRTLTRVVA